VSIANNSLQELSTDVSTSRYGVTNFRQPSRGHVVTSGVFALHVGGVASLEF